MAFFVTGLYINKLIINFIPTGTKQWQVFCLQLKKKRIMNVKRVFGTLLTILGIVALIYSAVSFMQNTGETRVIIVWAVLGIVFFISGIGLIRTTKDEQ